MGVMAHEQLRAALNSRVVIEQAKGVLAYHSGLPVDQAFDQLRGYARAHNLRLREVARQLVDCQLDPDRLVTGAAAEPDKPQ
jgi:AmiR/NasT family two-component response regulator